MYLQKQSLYNQFTELNKVLLYDIVIKTNSIVLE